MFTGIIEQLGTIQHIVQDQGNIILSVQSNLADELKIDQSVAHNGICLTVTSIHDQIHQVCAVPETISKTTLGSWKLGQRINLERCLKLQDRIDGHIVQGHVDTTAICIHRISNENSWIFRFRFPIEFRNLIIEKGSVAINGTSLTCFNITDDEFEVAIIPYTFEHTAIHQLQENDSVNIEFDVIGKYILRQQR